MRLIKYIHKIKKVMAITLQLVIYTLLNLSNDKSVYSFFQHPFLTIASLMGFLFLVMSFDFQNIMFSTRFSSRIKCQIKTIEWLLFLAFLYISSLFTCFLLIGIFLGDDFSLQKTFVFLLYSMINFVIISILLVSLSAKFGLMLANILLFCIIFAGFALNFAGQFFVRINFFFYNFNTIFNQTLIIDSLIIYTIISILVFSISFIKDKEL